MVLESPLSKACILIILELIEDSLQETLDDAVFLALQNLKLHLLNLLNSLQEDVSTHSMYLQSSVPSLVLAFDLYSSLTQEESLIALNHCKNPAFLGPGELYYAG